jgi:hypothetical protein
MPKTLETALGGLVFVTEKNWAGVTIKWDNRSEQTILHNDMAQVERVPSNLV